MGCISSGCKRPKLHLVGKRSIYKKALIYIVGWYRVELPDCSGKFETTTAVFTDTIETKWYVNLLGNLLPTIRTFNMTFDLIDGDNLILKLSSYQELTAD